MEDYVWSFLWSTEIFDLRSSMFVHIDSYIQSHNKFCVHLINELNLLPGFLFVIIVFIRQYCSQYQYMYTKHS